MNEPSHHKTQITNLFQTSDDEVYRGQYACVTPIDFFKIDVMGKCSYFQAMHWQIKTLPNN